MALPLYAIKAECHLCALHYSRLRAFGLTPIPKPFLGFHLAVFE